MPTPRASACPPPTPRVVPPLIPRRSPQVVDPLLERAAPVVARRDRQGQLEQALPALSRGRPKSGPGAFPRRCGGAQPPPPFGLLLGRRAFLGQSALRPLSTSYRATVVC